MSERRRLVIKIGTQILTEKNGDFSRDRLVNILKFAADLKKKGAEVICVISGAVGRGRYAMGIDKKSLTTLEKQACAAIGQPILMQIIREILEKFKITPAQLLLTTDDFTDRRRYLNLKSTLEMLLTWGALPVINENDPVSVAELQDPRTKVFGDNDKLSALVAAKLEANDLVLFTDVDGIYESDPKRDAKAKRLGEIMDLSVLNSISSAGESRLGRGGVRTKIEAARMAAVCGVRVLILSGNNPGIHKALVQWFIEGKGDHGGTLIHPQREMSGKKKWIRFSSTLKGAVVLNEGAEVAILKRYASLLVSGVIEVKGKFNRGDVILMESVRGDELGRGICNYSSQELDLVKGKKTSEIQKWIPDLERDEAIHRDDLVLWEGYGTKA